MEHGSLISRSVKICNASKESLQVFLEWEVPIIYLIKPAQCFVVYAVSHDPSLLESETTGMEMDFDSSNNTLAVYMPGAILLGDEFYLVDFETSERIKPRS